MTLHFLEADDVENIGDEQLPVLTICDADNNDVASVYCDENATVRIPRAKAIAYARLFAASEDMLAALIKAVKLPDHIGDVLNGMDAVTDEDVEMATPIFAAARAAISRATDGSGA